MIEVRLFATLAPRQADGSKHFEVEARPGLTARLIAEEAGLDPVDVYLVMVNGIHRSLDWRLADGDRLGLFPPVGGG